MTLNNVQRNAWTNQEVERLKRVYAISSKQGLLALFQRHPWGSIRDMAHQHKLRKGRGQDKWAAVVNNHIPVFSFGRCMEPTTMIWDNVQPIRHRTPLPRIETSRVWPATPGDNPGMSFSPAEVDRIWSLVTSTSRGSNVGE